MRKEATMDFDHDVVVVGSGFGGSVAALRLTEKGYGVHVLEAGRRFKDDDFAPTSWHLRKFLWAPAVGCFGIQRIHRLRDVLVLAGAGVGGGSLVYANTLYEPGDAFYQDPAWSHITDWRPELKPHYAQAKRMLGVVTYRRRTPADEVMADVAHEMGREHTIRPADVGVTFGAPGEPIPDPYFGGAGPERRGCLECGERMTGCRHGAKNTLVKNYLHLAERAGATVAPMSTVEKVAPLPDGGYEVTVRRTDRPWARRRITASQIVLAAGAFGTQRLLHTMRDNGVLPNLSPHLGKLTRTNSEALVGAGARTAETDYTRGVAISSAFAPDDETHVEPVRYGHGSDAMKFLVTVMARGGRGGLLRWLRALITRPGNLRVLLGRKWAERTVIALVMQDADNSITTSTRRGIFGRRMTSGPGHGTPNPTWLPVAHDVVRRMAQRMGGVAGASIGEPFGMPMTAHFIGGCTIATTPEAGVIDPYQRVHGYPGLHVFDGSAVSANLGVNPSLTITAQAERAASLWPNLGDADPRPTPGSAYQRVSAVAPRSPAVPPSAPAALQLPIAPI